MSATQPTTAYEIYIISLNRFSSQYYSAEQVTSFLSRDRVDASGYVIYGSDGERVNGADWLAALQPAATATGSDGDSGDAGVMVAASTTTAARADIDALKANWRNDPIWDIEDSCGFEAHRAELLDYRLQMEAQWAAEHRAKQEAKAAALGVPGNVTLATYVLALEARIDKLERAFDRHANAE